MTNRTANCSVETFRTTSLSLPRAFGRAISCLGSASSAVKNSCGFPGVILVGVLVAGCASFQAKPISEKLSLAGFESRTLNDPGLQQYLDAHRSSLVRPSPPKAWDLPMLTLAAFYYHPDLDVARAQWSVAKAKIVTAGATPNPTFSFTPQYNVNAVGGLSPWTLGAVLNIPIETAGKRGYRVRQAEQLSDAARLDIAGIAWRVRSGVRAEFVNLYAAQEQQKLLAGQQTIQERVVEVLQRRLQAGEASQPEVTLARLALDHTRLALEDARRRQGEAQAGLAQGLGLPATVLKDVNLSFDGLEGPLPNLPAPDVRQHALVTRPDVLAALARYAATQSALQLEIARQYPDLSLGPGYTWDQGARKWSVGISLALPLFNQNQGPIAEAEAGREEAAARFTALQMQVVGEIDQALASYSNVLVKLQVADRLLVGARRQRQSAQAQFAVGETDRLALLGAEQELAASALARLDTLIQAQQALGFLENAVEVPLQASGVLAERFTERPRQHQEPME